ncbi:MAG: PAS domain-containing protein [Phycisphaeraceae bacterium]|nr:PAS domain-containing protein [Phycisphaeraceae bacterium]
MSHLHHPSEPESAPSLPSGMDSGELRGVFAAIGADPMIGVAILGEDGHIFWVNPQMAQLFFGDKKTAHEAMGKNLASMYPGPWVDERLKLLKHAAATNKPIQLRSIWEGRQQYSWIHPLEAESEEEMAPDENHGGPMPRRFLVITKRVSGEGKTEELKQADGFDKVDSELIDLGPLDVLTSRELEVLALLGQGLAAAEIAKVLHRSVKTINTHRENIGKKLKIDDRVKLANVAQRAGLRFADAEKERV